MAGRFNQHINNRILFRLIELFWKTHKTLNSSSSDENKTLSIQIDMDEIRRAIGDDISNYIDNNIFSLKEVRSRKNPKQFFKTKKPGYPSFTVCLN